MLTKPSVSGKKREAIRRESASFAALIWRGLTTASIVRSAQLSDSCKFKETHQRTDDHGNPRPNEAFETISDY
jgi:hypothetical protein